MVDQFPIRGWYLISLLTVAAIVWAELTLPRSRMPAVLPLAVDAAVGTPGAVLLFAALHAVWSGAALRRRAGIPRRSLVVVAAVALASVAWYATSWAYGIRYQGPRTVGLYLDGSLLSLAALVGLVAWARWRPWLPLSLGFHTLSLVWFILLAFPYFGETP